MRFDTNDMEKILESDFLRFIDTTPTAQNPTWVLIAAVEEGNAGIDYNIDSERTKLIVNEGSITNQKSMDKQMSVPYIAYKNDPCFEFVEAGRDKLNYKTRILEVDIWNEDDNKYSAKMSNATIGITSYHGDTIEFDVFFDGDPTEGKVTMANNTPTFTPTASL
jgi:hypothetical protein